MKNEKICVCGDTENEHIENCEQCFVSDCGCQEFEEKVIAGVDFSNDLENLKRITTEIFSFDNVTKVVGDATQEAYGINPYKK